MSTRRSLMVLTVHLLVSLIFLGRGVEAQNGLPQPVAESSNTVGEVNAAVPIARYLVTSPGSDLLTIQVLAIGTSLVPHVRVLDAAAAVILEISNSAGQGSVTSDALLTAPGEYLIEVSGELGSTGQFALVLTSVTTSEPGMVDLAAGQPVEATAGGQSPPLVYRVYGVGMAGQMVTIAGTLPDVGPAYTIFDDTTGIVVASSDGTLMGGTHTLSGADIVYRVEVSSGNTGRDIPFTICLACATTNPGAAVAATSVPPTEIPPAEPTLVLECNVVPSITAGAVNVRRGPSTNSGFVGAIRAGESFPAMAQTREGGGWYKFNLRGVEGWVSASVAHLEGDCDALGVVITGSSSS